MLQNVTREPRTGEFSRVPHLRHVFPTLGDVDIKSHSNHFPSKKEETASPRKEIGKPGMKDKTFWPQRE